MDVSRVGSQICHVILNRQEEIHVIQNLRDLWSSYSYGALISYLLSCDQKVAFIAIGHSTWAMYSITATRIQAI